MYKSREITFTTQKVEYLGHIMRFEESRFLQFIVKRKINNRRELEDENAMTPEFKAIV